MNNHRIQYVVEILVATCVGPTAAIARLYLGSPVRQYKSPLCPLLRTSIESFDLVSLGILFCLCIIVGLTTTRNKGWVLGVLTMALFPAVAVAEMIVAPNSHNLFPIEFFLYGVAALIATGCVYSGRGVRIWVLRGSKRRVPGPR